MATEIGLMRNKYVWLLLAPSLTAFFVVLVIPFAITVIVSFTSWDLQTQGAPVFNGVKNYIGIFSDNRVLNSIIITLKFVVISVSVELLLGLTAALLVDRGGRILRSIQGLMMVPMIISPTVAGLLFYLLFSTEIGPLNYLLTNIGLPEINWLGSTSMAFWSVIIADVWYEFPFMFLLIFAALQGVSEQIYEAARVDGASYRQLTFYVTLPLIKYAISVAVLLRAIQAFKTFGVVLVLTGGGPGISTELLNLLIYREAFKNFRLGYSAAMIVALLILTFAVCYPYMRLSARSE